MRLQDMNKKTSALIILGITCLLLRMPLWFTYEPITYNDTPGYVKLALAIKNLDLSDYSGARTPIYPLFMASANVNYEIIWLMQSILGVAISLILFNITFLHTRHIFLSFLIGLAYSLSLNQLFFEATMLSETLATFLFILSLWVLAKIFLGKPYFKYYALIGVIVGLAILARPLLIFLIPLYAIFFLYYWLSRDINILHGLKNFLAFIIPATALVLGWSAFNKFSTGHFTITTIGGLALVGHSQHFIEFAPDKYANIRDIFLKHRAQGDPNRDVAWTAFKEIVQTTELPRIELIEQIKKMSIELFKAHPFLYFKSVFKAWVGFWKVTNYWKLEKINSQNMVKVLEVLNLTQKLLFILVNFIFLVIALSYFYNLIRYKKFNDEFGFILICIILAGSLAQALITLSSGNSRYGIPFQPMVHYIFLLWLMNLLGKKLSRYKQ